MKPKPVLTGLAGVVVLAAAGYGLYAIGMSRGMLMSDAPGAAGIAETAAADPSGWTVAQGEKASRRHIAENLKAGDMDPITGRRILFYHDPMVPGKRFEAPGKSPFMDMMLIPAYSGAQDADPGNVTVSARIQQNLGLRTAPVMDGALSPQVAAVGAIAFNERDQAVVQARSMGYVERLHVRATLDRVAKGQPLAELYVPEWVAAQEEFLSVRRMQGTELAPLIDAARQRMRQVGMSEEQIRDVEASGRIQPRFTVFAPLGGVVTELMLREGMTVMPGMTLFRINGLDTVWANAEVPESQVGLLRVGGKVRASSPAVPGVVFEGRVQAILPELEPQTRTLKARMELANPRWRLVPGMFAQMNFIDTREARALMVPSEAVIQTGRRSVVILAEEGGKFRPVEVEIGLESGDLTEIKRGLRAGQRVVLSGQFLIDSEASLKGLEARLNSEAAAPEASAAPAARPHRTSATVEAVKGDAVTLSHPPIPALQWPAMTMDFRLPPGVRVASGENVEIEFQMQDGDIPRITALRRAAPAAANAAGGRK